MAVNKARPAGNHFNNLGYRDRDMPYYGAESHMDGLCTIGVPQTVQEGTPEEIYVRYIASGPKGNLGRSPEVLGHNTVPLFQDPEMTLGMGSFTAFVFVCLNDQTREGCGQTSLLKGAHHATEKFLRWQRATNGRMGPEGPAGRASTMRRPTAVGSSTCRSPCASSFSTRRPSPRRTAGVGLARSRP